MRPHDEATAVRGRVLARGLARASLIDISDLDILAGRRLHRRGERRAA